MDERYYSKGILTEIQDIFLDTSIDAKTKDEYAMYSFIYNSIKKKLKGNKMKIFISQPMKDRTTEEIEKERLEIIEILKEKLPNVKFDICDTYFKDFDGKPLAFLAKALAILADADIAFFGKGWENARGCKIEHTCCIEYGIVTYEL